MLKLIMMFLHCIRLGHDARSDLESDMEKVIEFYESRKHYNPPSYQMPQSFRIIIEQEEKAE